MIDDREAARMVLAGLAMQGLLAGRGGLVPSTDLMQVTAEMAVVGADALIAELEKPK